MGCCASSDGGAQPGATDSSKPNSSAAETAAIPANTRTPSTSSPATGKTAQEPMSSSGGSYQASYIPKEAQGAKAFLPATAQSTHSDASTPAPVPTSRSSGPKAVRGWAPPTKEWDKDTKSKGDETRFEINEEWDEDGNLVRTTIKKTKTPDWKWKTEKTVDIIPAAEAAKQKK